MCKIKKYSIFYGVTLALSLGANQVATASCLPQKSMIQQENGESDQRVIGGGFSFRRSVTCDRMCW